MNKLTKWTEPKPKGDWYDGDEYTMCGGEKNNYSLQNQVCGECDNDTFKLVERVGGCVCNDQDDILIICAKCGAVND